MNTKSATFAVFGLCLLPLARLHAQADDNPTGPAGIFNGNITTGCSYDPFTGNAMRVVTDIVASGAVGDHPLAFTRIANTRNSPRNAGFAFAGQWRHNYSWKLTDEPIIYTVANTPPTSYTVEYPDGRVITFEAAPNGSPAKNAGETFFRGPRGISERFQQLNLTTNLAYLIMVDGRKVEFKATQYYTGSYYYRRYVAQADIDRYGLRTSLAYYADGTLNTITEPAGRYLQLVYTDKPNGIYSDHVIDHVSGSDGRVVHYSYLNAAFPPGTTTYNYLSTVSYYSDSSIGNATYTYKAPNTPDAFGAYNGTPMLATFDDSMYAGPMKKLTYAYVPNGTGVVYGQLQSEKRDATTTVSTIAAGGNGIDLTRTETRGDGPSRIFTYRTWPYVGHILFGYTGFVTTELGRSLGYDTSNYLTYFSDGNGHATTMVREPITGRITSLTHPPDINGVQSGVSYVYTDPLNPYYFANTKDELLHQTTYTRDSLHRITRIDYPDTAYETFSNYNVFNQALTHRLSSGGTEYYSYDTRGLKQTWQNAVNLPTNVTHYYYDNLDQVSGIQDPLGFQTDFLHNLRGEVTTTTRPPEAVTGLRYTVVNAYNPYGSLSSVTDELNHKTIYDRDDYQRVTKVTNPLNQFATNSYLPWGKTSSYLTTSDFVFSATSPSLKKVYNYCDNEFRKTQVTQAPGTSDQSISYFTYDGAGNQKTAKDPRGNQTTFNYDQRDRLASVLRPLAQTTTYSYDQASNKIKETRPDLKFRTWDTFDNRNRVKHMTGFLGDGTSYVYDFAGNMTQMTDSKGATYGFGYDYLNRKTSATYPVDAGNVVRIETWSYDESGNVAQYKNPSDQIQQFTYDNRNRQIESAWQPGFPDITTVYDAASRVTSVATDDGTTIGFGYDNANRQISEDQTLAGFPLRHIAMTVDVDGNRASISLAGVYTLYYQYTQRQQMSLVSTSTAAYYGFTYDLNGNITKQQDKIQGLDSTNFTYDALDRVTLCAQTGANDVSFATSHYDYDLSNNIQDTYRDEQAGKGERFGYDYANQLTSAVYNADNVQTPNPTNYDRSVSYTCDALNRTSMNDNGTMTSYTPNGLNQLTTVTGMASTYDQDFNQKKINGWVYTYDAARRVGDATNSTTGHSVQFSYDGLNRCVKRVTDGVTTLITYDGWKPIAEWDTAGTRTAWNMYGPGPDQILMRYRASDASYLHYHADQFGSVKFLLNSANTGIEKYTYDAFGGPKITDWAGNVRTDSVYGNRFMFTGREYLSTIGIYDYRNRMYSPLLGRFLQTDPLEFGAGDDNPYRYCGNNPTNASDPTGQLAVNNESFYSYYVPRNPSTLVGYHVEYPNGNRMQCAGTTQVLAGGYVNGTWHDVPKATGNWFEGAIVSNATRTGTLFATNWDSTGHYPNNPDGPNHTLIFGGMDGDDAVFYSATATTDIQKTVVGPDDQWRYREVNVSSNFNRTGLDSARSVGNVFDNHGNLVSTPLAAGVAIFNSIINFFANNPINLQTQPQASFSWGTHQQMAAPSLDTIIQP